MNAYIYLYIYICDGILINCVHVMIVVFFVFIFVPLFHLFLITIIIISIIILYSCYNYLLTIFNNCCFIVSFRSASCSCGGGGRRPAREDSPRNNY